MAVFRGFNCYVENGLSTVTAIFECLMNEADPGPYTQGEALTWTGGAGVHVTSGDFVLRLRRTSGVLPTVGLVITGSTSTQTATVANIIATDTNGVPLNPPNFMTNTRQNPLTAGDIFRIIQASALDTHGIVASTPTVEDQFVLTQNWAGETLTDFPGIVSQDVTAQYGWELPSQGDNQPIATIRNAINQIEDTIIGEAWTDVTVFSNDYQSRTTELQAPVGYMKDGIGFVHLRGALERTTGEGANGNVMFTLPAGYRPEYLSTFRVGGLWATAGGRDSMIRIDITGEVIFTDGDVYPTGPFLTIDGVIFKAV